ncbi:UDP-glucose 4-epimerase GalE [Pseudohongiella spirulinae]|uniref:UDP-glucose 4-epimerase n=1 Tax=Pseudohongiella spirulinae TaxID=1249552 RepID=A0A0S2KDL4_9GAMM|nr:UDP-glucose 4-epimerase GalE [Pseudohongiella spirulinae]ALO46407.1 UDP-galactose 4-epimerase [Pseudohongiella spirulinae]
MKVLVTGGAGYVGSHLVELLKLSNFTIHILDDLSTGHLWACQDCPLIQVDLTNRAAVLSILAEGKYDAVFHFAAKSIVSESATNPSIYYNTNVIGSINLLDAMINAGTRNLIFSSTAAVYGTPITNENIDEQHPTNPINTYGRSKLMIEQIIKDYCDAYQLNSIVFRYFNAAGASPSGKIGELHSPETHLIPNILKSIRNESPLSVFGDDYNTHDGTCIRDYIHVVDLAFAHKLALQFLKKNPGFNAFNLGTETGSSVMQVINVCEKLLVVKAEIRIADRRPGDPERLVATNQKACSQLNWRPSNSSLETIINSAWRWEKLLKETKMRKSDHFQ